MTLSRKSGGGCKLELAGAGWSWHHQPPDSRYAILSNLLTSELISFLCGCRGGGPGTGNFYKRLSLEPTNHKHPNHKLIICQDVIEDDLSGAGYRSNIQLPNKLKQNRLLQSQCKSVSLIVRRQSPGWLTGSLHPRHPPIRNMAPTICSLVSTPLPPAQESAQCPVCWRSHSASPLPHFHQHFQLVGFADRGQMPVVLDVDSLAMI